MKTFAEPNKSNQLGAALPLEVWMRNRLLEANDEEDVLAAALVASTVVLEA